MNVLLFNKLRYKDYIWLSIGIFTAACFIGLMIQFLQSTTFMIGLLGLLLSIVYMLFLLRRLQKVILLILILFPLASRLLYGLVFLDITRRVNLPAGAFFDLIIVGAFLAWVLRKLVKKRSQNDSGQPRAVEYLDHFMFLFLLYILFNYVRGLTLGNIGIFSEGRGFLYYLLFFPMVDAINIKRIQLEKFSKVICFLAFIYLGFFLIAAQGLLLPLDVRYVEHLRGFTFLESGLARTSLIGAPLSMVLFPLSLFLFLSSETKAGKRWALMAMLISLFINIRGNTRGLQVGLLVGLFVSLIVMGRRYRHHLLRHLPVLLLLIVIGSGMYVSLYGDQAQLLLSRWRASVHNDPNVIARIIQVKVFGAAFLKHPLLGNNLGTTQTYFTSTGYETKAGPHTEIVYWLYALGFLGTGLFGVMAFLIAKMGLYNTRNNALSDQARAVQKAILAILVTFFVVSFSSWQFRNWGMVPVIVAMFAYTRNLYLYSSFLKAEPSLKIERE